MVVVLAVSVGVVVVVVVIVVEKARSDCEQWSYDCHSTISTESQSERDNDEMMSAWLRTDRLILCCGALRAQKRTSEEFIFSLFALHFFPHVIPQRRVTDRSEHLQQMNRFEQT